MYLLKYITLAFANEVSKIHICEIIFATKIDEIFWDLIPQPSVQLSTIALTTGLRALVVFAWPGLLCYIE
jgi:hypothetical protein